LDVTVVVPAWGDYAGKALAEALDSLQTQDLPARIIVVDNASEPALAEPASVSSESRLPTSSSGTPTT
jgi:glycosyltransferase involved in cell wall biosynthesis